MSEFFSKADDCAIIASKLEEKLNDKIELDRTFPEIPSGHYLSSYRKNNGEYIRYFYYNVHCLPFYIKFIEKEFLRISVCTNHTDSEYGEKLAALSDFYEVLSEEYGNPTVFYTTKNDDEKAFNLQWSFINKKEEIERFKSGTYFDDALIDTLIVFGENKDKNQEYGFSDKTKELISKKVGLPFELLYLVDEDLENFVKYKNGKEMTIPIDSKIDGYPVMSFEKKLEKKLK